MMWSKLKKQLMLIIDDKDNFDIHCSVFKIKSAWTAGKNKYGISKSKEAVPRYWIDIDGKTIWDFPKDFIDEIKNNYFYWDNYTWFAETIRYYLDTPRSQLLTDTYKKDIYGLTNVLRKYDKRISKKIRIDM